MRKLFVFFLFMAGFVAHAQKFHYGVKADLNFSNIDGYGMATSLVSGAEIGVLGQMDLNKRWSFQPELLFTQSNTKKADNFLVYYNLNGNSYAGTDIKLSYINIPLLLNYKLNDQFSLMAGPQCGFLVYDNETLRRDNGPAYKNIEFSANLAGQFNISNVGLFVRYNRGISNINNIDNRYAWHAQHLQTGVAVKFK